MRTSWPPPSSRSFPLVLSLITAALTGCIADFDSDDAALAALKPDTAPVYTIQGVASGRCLQAIGGSAAASAQVVISGCDGSAVQQFRLEAAGKDRFVVRGDGRRCLAIAGAATANGAAAVLATCDGTTSQQWTFGSSNGVVRLKARHSGKVLAVADGTADGARVVQASQRADDNQRFQLVIEDGSDDNGGGSNNGGGDDGGGGNNGGGGNGGGDVRPGGIVNATIVVRAGEVFNGGGNRFIASPALGDGSQDEDQLPVFRLEDGAVLRNVVLGAPAADGVHTFGNVLVENVVWEDIGEDALTIKSSGRVEIRGGSAQNGDDKVLQVNAPSTLVVTGFTARNAGKFIRQNGGTTFRVDLVIDRCEISQMDEAIARTDSATSTVKMTNTRFSQIVDANFIGFAARNVTESGNTEF